LPSTDWHFYIITGPPESKSFLAITTLPSPLKGEALGRGEKEVQDEKDF